MQRVCPTCARISYETAARCPYCGSSFRRRGLLAMALLLTAFSIVILGGIALLLIAAGNEFDRRVDRQVERVHREFRGDFESIRREVRQELDRRLPSPTP